MDTILRKHPNCGVILTGDFNQLRDDFLRTHYKYKQLVNKPTRLNAILDKLWTNMSAVYDSPEVLDELGASDHRMVLLSTTGHPSLDTGSVQHVITRCMGHTERAMFASALSRVRWEPLYHLPTCQEQFEYFQCYMDNLIATSFPYKTVTRHTHDKPWVTDSFRELIRKRQRARMSGDMDLAHRLRNKVNRTAQRLRHDFYQSQISSLEDSSSRDWWKKMKRLMGVSSESHAALQGLANRQTEGNTEVLANVINDFLVSVSSDMPRLTASHEVFHVHEPLPSEYIISVNDTEAALSRVKVNKATGPDNIQPWIIRDFAHLLASPLAAIFNSSLREGVLPDLWKTAIVVPLPKRYPPTSIEKDLRPISLTPIVVKVFESFVMKWVDNCIKDKIDPYQFGCVAGTSTTDALVEILHKWYEATDQQGTYIRILLLDYSKAFDLINHKILIGKLVSMDIPPHIVRWMAAFLMNRTQRVKVGDALSQPGCPNGGVPQGTLSGPKDFLVHINDLSTPCNTYKYVDDSTIFEVCNCDTLSIIQEAADVAGNWTRANDMCINASKTKEMVIRFGYDRDLVDSVPHIVIDDVDIERVNHAKMLGVTVSANLTWNAHVDNIVAKASKRLYMLYQLKRSGINQHDLLRIYISVIRPVVEYACPVWHTNLPKYLSDNIELIQKRALRTIYPGYHYEMCLDKSNITTLAARRDTLCIDYFNKMKHSSHKLNKLLPDNRDVPYNLRTLNILPVPRARTNRFKNSFIPWCLNNHQ